MMIFSLQMLEGLGTTLIFSLAEQSGNDLLKAVLHLKF